jgi:hypothetical protein
MKLLKYISICIFALLTTSANLAFAQNYCAPTGSAEYERIMKFTLSTTTGTQIFTYDSSNNNNDVHYQDFKSMKMNANRGVDYRAEIVPQFPNNYTYTESYRVWADLNRDGEFSNSEIQFTETVNNNALPPNAKGIINIPATTLPGELRLRIGMKFGSQAPTACQTSNYGQFEDYTIIVAATPIPPTATPTATATLASRVQLLEVNVNACDVRVNYTKQLDSCAHLVTAQGNQALHQQNFFCNQNGPVNLKRSDFITPPFAPGLTVKLCNGNNSNECSAPLAIAGGGICAPPTATPTSTSTRTPVPPTATPIPPTATPVPPTATPVPPTATPVPPTATPLPPTSTATNTPNPSSTYCPQLTPISTSYEHIKKFSVFSVLAPVTELFVNDSSDITKTFNLAPYQDFSTTDFGNRNLKANIGTAYDVRIEPGFTPPTPAFRESYRVWIDFNKNNTFEDSEIVFSKNNVQGVASDRIKIPVSITLNTGAKIPMPLGNTRLRVAMRFGATPPLACGPNHWGQVEDYTIDIQPCTTYWQNPANRFDVDNDTFVSPLDVFTLNEWFNQPNPKPSNYTCELPADRNPTPFYDVDGDLYISPLDVLALNDRLNNPPTATPTPTATPQCPKRWQNLANRFDVNNDTYVSPLDVLTLNNYLNQRVSTNTCTLLLNENPPPYYDVNGDLYISPLDLLELQDRLNNPPTNTPTPVPPTATATSAVPQCTPPACPPNSLVCPTGNCPGGCGVVCVTPTPTVTPTATLVPPTNTPVPPTATPVPPTATPIPPTPTFTPTPLPTICAATTTETTARPSFADIKIQDFKITQSYETYRFFDTDVNNISVVRGKYISLLYGIWPAIGEPNSQIAAWIDFNNNSQFEEAERVLTPRNTLEDENLRRLVEIPTTAALGKARLRLRITKANVTPVACGAIPAGQTIDLNINITNGAETAPINFISRDFPPGFVVQATAPYSNGVYVVGSMVDVNTGTQCIGAVNMIASNPTSSNYFTIQNTNTLCLQALTHNKPNAIKGAAVDGQNRLFILYSSGQKLLLIRTNAPGQFDHFNGGVPLEIPTLGTTGLTDASLVVSKWAGGSVALKKVSGGLRIIPFTEFAALNQAIELFTLITNSGTIYVAAIADALNASFQRELLARKMITGGYSDPAYGFQGEARMVNYRSFRIRDMVEKNGAITILADSQPGYSDGATLAQFSASGQPNLSFGAHPHFGQEILPLQIADGMTLDANPGSNSITVTQRSTPHGVLAQRYRLVDGKAIASSFKAFTTMDTIGLPFVIVGAPTNYLTTITGNHGARVAIGSGQP